MADWQNITTLPKLMRRSRPWRRPRASAVALRHEPRRAAGGVLVDQTTMVPAGHGGESMAHCRPARRAAARAGYERGAHAGDGWRELVESRI